MKESCKGCVIGKWFDEIYYNTQCSFQMMNTEAICPCGDCLVKTMCRKGCNERTAALRIDIPEELLDEGKL